jgi:sugar lactone lactonase YvrE
MAVNVECVLQIREGGGPKGECPVWSVAEQKLYWVDIDGGTLNRFDTESGKNTVFSLGERIGCFSLRQRGGFVLATASGIWLSDGDPTVRHFLANPEAALPTNRPNDGRSDPAGRFWYGTMCDPPSASDTPQGSLYILEAGAQPKLAASGLFVANGLAFSPDGKMLYHSDSFHAVRTIWACELDMDGTIVRRREFVTMKGLPGRPDGACVDSDGCYWSCHIDGGQVVRYTPSGQVDRVIPVPVKWPTMCAFGGSDLGTLFITSLRRGGAAAEWPDQPLAGSIFACRPGVTGIPEPKFAG